MSDERARMTAIQVEAVEVDAEGAVERRSPVHPLEVVGLLGNVLADIRTIAEGMATLPKLLGALNQIESKVEILNEEVHRMRTRVDGMADDVGEVRVGIDRVEPHLEDIGKVVHPLRRIRRREADPAE
jgi:uncharacterized protein YoxC